MSTSTLTTKLPSPPPIPTASVDGAPEPHVTVIESRPGWHLVDFRELFRYRDLLYFLTFRGVKVLYAQSAIGIGWAVLQPLCSMIVFSVIFGRFAGIESDGVPYAIFSFVALVPWTYFSNAMMDASNSLVNQSQMITKVYFPRVILPLSSVLAKLIDFCIASVMLAILMVCFRVTPTWNILFLPLLIMIMVCSAAGLGMWLTAIAIQYRDVKHALGFISQLIMYATPVIYSASIIPERYTFSNGVTLWTLWIYAINPMVGVIEGFRAALLGTRPMPWDLIAIGATTAALLLFSGLMHFRRRERLFADVA